MRKIFAVGMILFTGAWLAVSHAEERTLPKCLFSNAFLSFYVKCGGYEEIYSPLNSFGPIITLYSMEKNEFATVDWEEVKDVCKTSHIGEEAFCDSLAPEPKTLAQLPAERTLPKCHLSNTFLSYYLKCGRYEATYSPLNSYGAIVTLYSMEKNGFATVDWEEVKGVCKTSHIGDEAFCDSLAPRPKTVAELPTE